MAYSSESSPFHHYKLAPNKKQPDVINVGGTWMPLSEANKQVKAGGLTGKAVAQAWSSREKDRQKAPDEIKAAQGWDTNKYARSLVEKRDAQANPLLSNAEMVGANPKDNPNTTQFAAHNKDDIRGANLAAARAELEGGVEGAVGPDGKTSGPIEVPLETMDYVSSSDAPYTREDPPLSHLTSDAPYTTNDPPLSHLTSGDLEPRGDSYSAPPTDLNRQVFASELRGALGGKTEGQMHSVMSADRQAKAEKLGISAGQVSSFLQKEFGKQGAEQKEKDRLAKYNEFYDRTTGAGSGLAGRKRKLYARNAGLKRAIQLRKKGFGSAAERLALGAASSLEAQGPAVASQGYLQAVEDNKAQASRQRSINQQLGVKLLAGLN